jgi:hypothetical protein
MDAALLTELEAIPGLIQDARVPDAARQTAAWCLRQLPDQYRDFCRTCDCRHGDEIRRVVEGLLLALADDPGAVESITGQIRAMHARLGIPPVKFSPPRPARKKKRG